MAYFVRRLPPLRFVATCTYRTVCQEELTGQVPMGVTPVGSSCAASCKSICIFKYMGDALSMKDSVGKLCYMFNIPGGMAVLGSVSKTLRKDSVLYSVPVTTPR